MAVTWAVRCLLWGCFFGFVTAYVVNYCWITRQSDMSWELKAISGILAVFGGLSTVVALHISTLRCSETHTLKTLLLEYVIMRVIDLIAPFVKIKMAEVWKHPIKEQERLLKKLLARDADTEYGRRHGFGNIHSLQEFRDKHPLTKYDYYRDYFQRLADGEENVCVAGKVDRFGSTSGTTGKSKLIPMINNPIGPILIIAMPRIHNKVSPVQKGALLYCKPDQKFTKTGLPIAPVFLVPDSVEIVMNAIQNTPFSGFQIKTDFEATYVHVLFALADKNIYQFFAPFASQVYRAFKMLEDEQNMFLEDLAKGRVNPKLQIDGEIRRSLNAALTAKPARANELREEFAKGFVGIVGRIWPYLEYIMTADISGYMKKLDARYTRGTKLHASLYVSTEGVLGINLWTDRTPQQYTLFPNVMVVEFIPEHLSGEENPQTLLMVEVEIGKKYEVVMTTKCGLYRYRVGDVVEVVGFHERCPVIAVKYRTGELLNLRGEKMDTLVVSNAIQESLEGWTGASLVEWACAESPLKYKDTDIGEYDQFYMLFIELESETDISLSAEQKSLFDKSLCKQHDYYKTCRQIGTTCEARVLVVRPGTFQKLKEFIIEASTVSHNQFKMPKKLRTKATLELMLACVVDSDDMP